jgi:hypothetical protein
MDGWLDSGTDDLMRLFGRTEWRMTDANANYIFCKSYPPSFLVPTAITDEELWEIATYRGHGRIPSVHWRHERHGAVCHLYLYYWIALVLSYLQTYLLSIDARFQILANETGQDDVRLIGRNNYDKLLCLLACSNPTTNTLYIIEPYNAASLSATLSPPVPVSSSSSSSTSTPTTTIQSATTNATSQAAASSSSSSSSSPLSSSIPDFTNPAPGLTESQLQIPVLGSSMGGNSSNNDEPTIKHAILGLAPPEVVVDSWLKLEECIAKDSDNSWGIHVAQSKWLCGIKMLLESASKLVQLLDVRGASVLLSSPHSPIEASYIDASCQLLSLVQIIADPYYRTIRGFRILLEKDWLNTGYRFADKCNHYLRLSGTVDDKERVKLVHEAIKTGKFTKGPGASPTFIQFLDCVWQLTKQYPQRSVAIAYRAMSVLY